MCPYETKATFPKLSDKCDYVTCNVVISFESSSLGTMLNRRNVLFWFLYFSPSNLDMGGFSSVQFSHSVVSNSAPREHPMNHSTPGLSVHHQFQEFSPTHVHRVRETIQPSHPLSSLSPPAPSPSQHESLFQWVSSSHEVAKGLEFQL